MNSLSKRNDLQSLISLKMTDLITFVDNNGKSAIYAGGNIHGLYIYLEVILTPTTLTISGQRSHHFGALYSINNYSATLQLVIASLCVQQKNICECCGIILHKSDACIIRVPNFLPPRIRKQMYQFNALNGD